MVEPKRKLCFIVGPIGPEGSDTRTHSDWLLEGIIRPAMSEFPEFRLKRADEDSRPGLIDAQIIGDLLEADLVIADLSLLNPNAFYEIGIRHMAQKPIIHVQLETEDVPFDVSLYRALKFSVRQHKDVLVAQRRLKDMVRAVLDSGYQVSNPVTQARGQIKLAENASSSEAVILARMQALEGRIDDLVRDWLEPFPHRPRRPQAPPSVPLSPAMELAAHVRENPHQFINAMKTVAEEMGLQLSATNTDDQEVMAMVWGGDTTKLEEFRERIGSLGLLSFMHNKMTFIATGDRRHDRTKLD